MADIHTTPEAIRAHADAVNDVASRVQDGVAASIRSVPDMNFGVIPGPTIYPPMLALFGVAEAAMESLAGLAGDIALGLDGVAELYETAERVTKAVVQKSGQS